MLEIKLYTREGGYVETVLVPPFEPGAEPEGIFWGSRLFLKGADGVYREGFARQAYTQRELKAMGAA